MTVGEGSLWVVVVEEALGGVLELAETVAP